MPHREAVTCRCPRARRSWYLVLPALILTCGACRREAPDAKQADHLRAGTNVLLITLDTTRADRIGCYGYTGAHTPVLDGLGARGVIFQRAQSQVPLTLPSHASILTGRYPKEHGLRVNGRNALGPTPPTLPEAFKAHGYRTAAFVSAGVIDSRYGLNRGFDVYGDDLASPGKHRSDQAQRRGDAVTDEALAWLDSAADGPFFAWIHYYDPHQPYDPPSPYGEEAPTPYDGEIAFVDAQIGRVVRWLEKRQLSANTLLVLVGDHGESLGEHGTFGHTTFVYQTNLHVPLMFVHPALRAGHRVAAVVENVDIYPTVLDLMGWARAPDLLSRSLVPALGGRQFDSVASYAESHHVNWAFNWAQQRSLTTDRWKYISSTRPELYDLTADPHEKRSVLNDYPGVAERMRQALAARFAEMTPGKAAEVRLDEQGRQALESLGYLSGGTAAETGDFLTQDLPDPKDMLPVIGLVDRAAAALEADHPDQATTLLSQAIQISPNSMTIYYQLGRAHHARHEYDLTVAALRRALDLDPRYVPALSLMASSLDELGRKGEARRYFEAILSIDGTNSRALRSLADISRDEGNTDHAIELLKRALSCQPNYVAALTDLSNLLEKRGAHDRALELALQAADADPKAYETQVNAGLLLLRAGRVDEAAAAFVRAAELNPAVAPQLVGQAIKLHDAGNTEAATVLLNALAKGGSAATDARYQIARWLSAAGDTAGAIRTYRSVLTLSPAHKGAVSALVSLYLSAKRVRDAVDVLESALSHAPKSVAILRPLASLLATVPDETIRDGKRAIELATRALRQGDDKDPVLLATLAAAYAESGNFDEAVRTGSSAAAVARDRDLQRLADVIDAQVRGYRKGVAFHDLNLRP